MLRTCDLNVLCIMHTSAAYSPPAYFKGECIQMSFELGSITSNQSLSWLGVMFSICAAYLPHAYFEGKLVQVTSLNWLCPYSSLSLSETST